MRERNQLDPFGFIFETKQRDLPAADCADGILCFHRDLFWYRIAGENVEESFRVVGQEVYNRVQLGEYSIHEGWDGVKAGYRRAGLDYDLVEAEAARTSCC